LRRDYEESTDRVGLTVFSTLDPLLQQKAEDALAEELERLDKSAARPRRPRGVVVVTTRRRERWWRSSADGARRSRASIAR